MASRGEDEKGVNEGKGRKKGLLGTEDGPVPSTFTGIAVKWMTHVMTGSFTGRAVAEMVQKYTGSHPVDVEVSE